MGRTSSGHDKVLKVTPKVVVYLLMCGLSLAVSVGSASAAKTRVLSGQAFGPEGVGGGGTFDHLKAVAVDSADGAVYALDMAESVFSESTTLYRFDSDGAPLPFSTLGVNHIDDIGGTAQAAEAEVAVAPPGALGGTAGDIYVADNASVKIYSPSGESLGELTGVEPCGVAVDPAGHVFVGEYPATIREFSPAANPVVAGDQTAISTAALPEICNVAVDSAGTLYAAAWDAKAFARLEGVTDSTPTVVEPGGAPIAIAPATDDLYVDRADRVAVFDSSGNPRYEFGSGDVDGSYGVAIDPSTDRAYVADGTTGTVKVFGPSLTVPTTEPATGVRAEAAVLHGTLYPEGRQYTDCRFEFGLATAAGFERTADCDPIASQIPPDSQPQAVSLALDGLRPDSDYKFRLVATNSAGTLAGDTLAFSTAGPPRMTELLSRANQGSATVEATIDPRGAGTTYRIEWGPTTSYGNVARTGDIGAGDGSSRVTARLEGLTAATAYHWRVTAESAEGGESASPDQKVETLNSCGLTDGRCLELVSRADKGPLASPGMSVPAGSQIKFQADPGGSALAYTVAYGYPDATVGDAALYLAHRGPAGWASEQLSPPTTVPGTGTVAVNSKFKVLSSDLDCGVVASLAPLAPGAPATVTEAGGANLYLSEDAGRSYRTITSLPPVGPPSPEEVAEGGGMGAAEYQVVGLSPDCRRVVFRSIYRYPGIPVVAGAKFQLYEWDDGTLRSVAVIPGPGGPAEPVPAGSLPGGMDEEPSSPVPFGNKRASDYWRAVSADASRTIFTAVSRFGPDSGRRAVFARDAANAGVRTGAVPATDVSQSETAIPDDGNARYWIASVDGERIFFTARYGLAANGSSTGATSCANAPRGAAGTGTGEGCDLYEYDAAAPPGERLTDLSADVADRKGAGVVGVLDASDDGAYVYFAARGRLGDGGRSEAENLERAAYNIYLAHAGSIRFVHALGEADAIGLGRALVDTEVTGRWTSRSTPEGTSLAFESSLGVPGDVPMVYLYSAAAGTTVCVSCRRDGRPPFSGQRLTSLIDSVQSDAENRVVRPTVLTANGRRLYFYSSDPLAPGGLEGIRNLYQWESGQVSLIATEPPGVPSGAGQVDGNAFFGGTDAEGNDVYFATTRGLIPGDRDERWDVYDARVGGGFPEPTPPAPPCDADTEGACNSGRAGLPVPAAAPTSTFSGPGNVPARRQKPRHKGRHQKKRQGQDKHGKKRRKESHTRRGEPRRAGGDRRAAK